MEFWIANFAMFAGALALYLDDRLSFNMKLVLWIVLIGSTTASYNASEAHKHTHEILETLTDRQFGENGAET